VTVSEHDQERLQELESELTKTKAELARVVREQALAAESLRASEELKSRLIACSRDCIKILDLEGRLLFMNEGGMQVLEICDIGPFLNGPWVEFWDGADREAAKAALQTAKDGGIGRFVGYFETRTSRQPRWWDVVVSPVYDASGKPDRLLALSRDITQHKKNEAALCEAAQFNREIIEGAAEGIIVYDAELRYEIKKYSAESRPRCSPG
jgi:PAS domain-containing protein